MEVGESVLYECLFKIIGQLILPLLNISADIVMPIALATSLASIVVTSSSAAIIHHKNNNIPWPLAKKLMVWARKGYKIISSFKNLFHEIICVVTVVILERLQLLFITLDSKVCSNKKNSKKQ